MITECMIFLASVLPMGFDESKVINNYLQCNNNVPKSMQQYAEYYIEHFDIENIDTAVRIGWCESRGNTNAVRTAEGNFDSGVMQFVSWTWNWVAEMYDLPMWNDWVIMYHDRPYTSEKVSRSSMGFSQEKAQYTKYYNTKFAYLLSQEIYKQKWKDWSSSEWCWGDTDKWLRLVKQERSM